MGLGKSSSNRIHTQTHQAKRHARQTSTRQTKSNNLFADYYEQQHWAIEHEGREDISEEPILPTSMEVETGEITTKELDDAIRKLKNNKAPGPDDIPAELFKWLDEQSRTIIL